MKALPEGQYIKHHRYGMGVVTESNERQTSIDFDCPWSEAIRHHRDGGRAFRSDASCGGTRRTRRQGLCSPSTKGAS